MPCQHSRYSPQFGNKCRDECDVWAWKVGVHNICRLTQELQEEVGHERCAVNLSRYVKTFNSQTVNFPRSSFERLITTHHSYFVSATSKILCQIVDIRFSSSPPWRKETIHNHYSQESILVICTQPLSNQTYGRRSATGKNSLQVSFSGSSGRLNILTCNLLTSTISPSFARL